MAVVRVSWLKLCQLINNDVIVCTAVLTIMTWNLYGLVAGYLIP